LLRTIFKHLDAGRANTADGELEVRRKTIHLLLGEKGRDEGGRKTKRRTAPTLHLLHADAIEIGAAIRGGGVRVTGAAGLTNDVALDGGERRWRSIGAALEI